MSKSSCNLLVSLVIVTVFQGIFLGGSTVSAQCDVVVDPTDPSVYYDLNPLADNLMDYTCVNSRYPSYSFFISVCRPLLMVDSVCVPGTGICEASIFSSSKIGMASLSFGVNEDKSLHMAYPAGTNCFSGSINFRCNPSAGAGKPVYLDENCVYSFLWETMYACPVAGPAPTQPPVSPPGQLPTLDTFEEILAHLEGGRAVRLVYDADHCVNNNVTTSGGGITISSFVHNSAQGFISYSESYMARVGSFVEMVVTVRISDLNTVVITSSSLDPVSARLLGEETSTCRFGEGVTEAHFFSLGE